MEPAEIAKNIIAQAQERGQLAAAYVAAWGEIGAGVVKDANNPHFGNDYATLEAVTSLVKPVLAKHGLAFLQTPGAIDGDRLEMIGILLHTSGQSLSFRMHVPLGGKQTAQTMGSATTYARRYQLLAVFGLAPVDDDGEAASAPAPAPKKKAANGGDKATVLKTIEKFAGTADEFSEDVKPLVEELGDKEVNAAYVAKRRELTAKGK